MVCPEPTRSRLWQRQSRAGRWHPLLAGLFCVLAGCSRNQTSPATQGETGAPRATASGAENLPAMGEPVPGSTPAPPSEAAAELATATPDKPLRPTPAPDGGARNSPGAPPAALASAEILRMPAGFSIEVYANNVPNARSLARGAAGTVFVSTRQKDRVYAIVDRNGDRKVDETHVVAKDLDTPNGIAYKDGALYIAEIPRLWRIDGIDNRLANPPKPVLVTDKLPDHKHHGWRYIRFGPDGWLYVAVGAPCNVCKREEPIFSTIARMKPDGSGLQVFASGVRNSVGFDWHPQTRELWFTENGRDALGNDLPPDELNRAAKAGLHFGFPYCHAGVILDPEFGAGRSCTELEAPVQKLGAHVAALGMRFYTGKMFPPQYQNSILFAEHGSWNRERKNGYRVMVVRLDGHRALSYEPLITWLDEKRDEVWGRPVDVEMLEDGSLLVSDDWRGVVYRVTYKG